MAGLMHRDESASAAQALDRRQTGSGNNVKPGLSQGATLEVSGFDAASSHSRGRDDALNAVCRPRLSVRPQESSCCPCTNEAFCNTLVLGGEAAPSNVRTAQTGW